MTSRTASTIRTGARSSNGLRAGPVSSVRSVREGFLRRRLSALVHLASLLLLILAAACCPVPTSAGGDTAFAATIEAVPGGQVDTRSPSGEPLQARLRNGRTVRLVLPVDMEPSPVGTLVWVEGTASGATVQVRSLRVVEMVSSEAG